MSTKFTPPCFVRALSRKLHRLKSRYCLKLDESEMSLLRCEADLQEDESFVMLIDDSAFCKRTKNVVFTDRRILWQEKRGAQYKSISLESLNDASVFFEPFGFGSVITVLNGSSCTQFRFNNIRAGDLLRIVFHDYLSRYCEGYAPLEKENKTRYKKECVPSFRRHSIVNLIFALAGCALVLIFSILGADYWWLFHRGGWLPEWVWGLLGLGIAFLTVNILLPASKSKVSKAVLLILFSMFSAVNAGFGSVVEGVRNINIVFILGFLKLDRFESDGVGKNVLFFAGVFVLLCLFLMFQ